MRKLAHIMSIEDFSHIPAQFQTASQVHAPQMACNCLPNQCCDKFYYPVCRGYILGGLLWFAVPYTLATTLGLTALALDLPLSAKEVASGLVPPAVAYHLFGKGGVILIAIMVFMAGVHQTMTALVFGNNAATVNRACASLVAPIRCLRCEALKV